MPQGVQVQILFLAPHQKAALSGVFVINVDFFVKVCYNEKVVHH